MSARLKIGNKTIYIIGPLEDEDGNTVTNLNTADDLIYMIKDNETDSNDNALIKKYKSSGAITINLPEVGNVAITLDAGDSIDKGIGKKYHALQIDYPSLDIQEIDFVNGDGKTDQTIFLVQDVIR